MHVGATVEQAVAPQQEYCPVGHAEQIELRSCGMYCAHPEHARAPVPLLNVLEPQLEYATRVLELCLYTSAPLGATFNENLQPIKVTGVLSPEI